MANVLGELFSDIASSIRSGLGEVELMKPTSFPAKIDEIVALIGAGSSGGSGNTGGGEVSGGNIGTLNFKTGSFTADNLDLALDFTKYEFSESASYEGIYVKEIASAPCVLDPSKSYAVSWDYTFATMETPESVSAIAGRTGCYVMGNKSLVLASGDDTGEDWLFIYSPKTNENIIFTKSKAQAHTIGIWNPATTRVSKTVAHSLGEIPDFVMVCYAGVLLKDTYLEAIPAPVISVWGFKSEFKTHTERLGCISTPGFFSANSVYGIDNMNSSGQSSGYIHCPDANTFKVGRTSGSAANFQFVPGGTYYWIAIANMGGADLPSAEEVSF